MEIYKNKDWLIDQYQNQKKSMRKISREIDCHHTTIMCWLNKFGIIRKEELYNNKKWLYEQYIILEKTSIEIAKICNCSFTTILNRLKKLNA